MGFCTKCGKEVPEDAYFCLSCGARTLKGREAGVSAPLDEMRDALSTMGRELEKAFQTAAKEIRGTFETARENVKQSIPMKPVICKNWGQKISATPTSALNAVKNSSRTRKQHSGR